MDLAAYLFCILSPGCFLAFAIQEWLATSTARRKMACMVVPAMKVDGDTFQLISGIVDSNSNWYTTMHRNIWSIHLLKRPRPLLMRNSPKTSVQEQWALNGRWHCEGTFEVGESSLNGSHLWLANMTFPRGWIYSWNEISDSWAWESLSTGRVPELGVLE